MPKDKNKPKGKMSAYACFVQECRREHEKKYPDKQVVFTEFSKKCAERWKTMNDGEKKRFQDLAETDKRRYERDMAKYVPPKGQEGGRRKRKKKDPNAPKRAMSAFFMYCADARPKVRAAHPDFQVGDIAKILGKQWKEITDSDKAKYEKKAQTDKARYQKELAEYKRTGGGASPAKKGRPAKKAAPPPKRVEEDDDEDDDEEEEEEEEEEEIVEEWEEKVEPHVTRDARYGYSMPGVTLVKGPRDLKGPKRMVADGVASEEECKMLSHLAKGGTEGNGYEGDKHVHTEFERFDGLTVLQAAELAKRGRVSVDHAEMYLNLSNKARRYVHGYFHMKHQLFFTYTHLVCRTAEPYSTDDRTDLSHPIHADNCHLLADGSCPKKLPAFTWRDWSAILYLNDGFKGGEFIFAHKNESVQSSVQPKCGRLVGFSAGEENLHGVKAVLKGRRCALAMWYTMDERYNEVEHYQARKLLQSLKKHSTKPSKERPKEEL